MIVEQFIRAQRADAATGRTPGPVPEARARALLLQHRRETVFPIVRLLMGVGELLRDFVRATTEYIRAFSDLERTVGACAGHGRPLPATHRRPAVK